jgi:hypothetical protein
MRIAFPPRHSTRYWRFFVSKSSSDPGGKLLNSTNSADIIDDILDSARRELVAGFGLTWQMPA